LSAEAIREIFTDFAAHDTVLHVDINDAAKNACLTFRAAAGAASTEKSYPFRLDGFERALVEAGGWLHYAEARY
jgi:3-isopropylmalate/(R)-2-methylmalate dehydratase small subunit